jgi:hypothetical protein
VGSSRRWVLSSLSYCMRAVNGDDRSVAHRASTLHLTRASRSSSRGEARSVVSAFPVRSGKGYARIASGALLLSVAFGAVCAPMGFGASFGANLTDAVEPAPAADQGYPCFFDPGMCTRVLMKGFHNQGHARAPRDGTIRTIKLIARGPGKFRLQLARTKEGGELARIVRSGPIIRYEGQPDGDAPYRIERFDVRVPVEEGERLAIKARTTQMLRRCHRNRRLRLQLLFTSPPLAESFRSPTGSQSCFLLLEGVLASRRGA